MEVYSENGKIWDCYNVHVHTHTDAEHDHNNNIAGSRY